MAITVCSLSRYPVKGLGGQTLENLLLVPGKGFPGDRQYGFARPSSGFDPSNPKPLPKSKFYMLARDPALALLKTEFNDKTGVLSLSNADTDEQFDLHTSGGKRAAAQFLQRFLCLPEHETPHLFEASPHRFTDVSVVSTAMMNALSMINLDSVKAFSNAIGQDIDPRRFRGNIHIAGLAPFSELEMVGQKFTIGAAQLKIVMRTKRCPATKVNLRTGKRDLDTPALLQEHYGHQDMGIYAEVLKGGTISKGDNVELM